VQQGQRVINIFFRMGQVTSRKNGYAQGAQPQDRLKSRKLDDLDLRNVLLLNNQLQQEVLIKDHEGNQCSNDDEQWWWSKDH
jgi:hypothetical protein